MKHGTHQRIINVAITQIEVVSNNMNQNQQTTGRRFYQIVNGFVFPGVLTKFPNVFFFFMIQKLQGLTIKHKPCGKTQFLKALALVIGKQNGCSYNIKWVILEEEEFRSVRKCYWL